MPKPSLTATNPLAPTPSDSVIVSGAGFKNSPVTVNFGDSSSESANPEGGEFRTKVHAFSTPGTYRVEARYNGQPNVVATVEVTV